MVARLQADGALDTLFGEGGVHVGRSSRVDGNAAFANPGDVTVLQTATCSFQAVAATAFVARLVGGSGNDVRAFWVSGIFASRRPKRLNRRSLRSDVWAARPAA